MSIDEIADFLQSSHGTVWRAMEEYDIPRRNLSESHIKHRRADFSGDLTEKAYLIGLRVGDLAVAMNKEQVAKQSPSVVIVLDRSRSNSFVPSLHLMDMSVLLRMQAEQCKLCVTSSGGEI